MKNRHKILIAAAAAIVICTACGENDNRPLTVNTTGNAVDQVIQDEINKASEASANPSPTQEPGSASTSGSTPTPTDVPTPVIEVTGQETFPESDVDIDLTLMGSDMVYATVYQFMYDPFSYEGKTVRIKGNYYPSYYEPTGQYYQYAVIQDATACCSQGMEFVWDDGSHVYPDEYPAEGTEIVVTGTFETYKEEDLLYCRLADAQMEPVR